MNTPLFAYSKPFSQCNEIECCFTQLPYCEGWAMGSCHAEHPAGSCSTYEVFDREHSSHWLFTGSWPAWDRVRLVWGELSFVSKTIQSISQLFAADGPILPESKWIACGKRFIGLTKRRSSTPFMSAISKENPPCLTNLVQLTGFFRLFQHQTKHLVSVDREVKMISILDGAHDLVEAVKKYIPDYSSFRDWETFYLKNAYNVATSTSTEMSLSFGSFATSCLAYSERGALIIDYPFFLDTNVEDTDLCELLFAFLDLSVQDRQYLIDLYYDMEAPLHFFNLMAYHHMTKMLEAIADENLTICQRVIWIDRFEKMARSYDLFRAPVPTWYV